MNTSTTTKSKNKPPKSTPSTFIKIIEFWFYLIQILTVLFSWRVYFLFIDSKKKIENNNNNDNDNNNTNKNDEKRYLTFKEKVQHNFFCLFTDTLYFMMLIITCTLFFWRLKDTLSLLKKSDSSKYKQIIWDQFSGGFVEFGSFTVLLLLKWPVIFKVFWNKGTEKEDKSTWSQIFMREFSQEVDKNKLGGPKPPTTNTTNFSGNGSSSSTTNATSSSSSQANNKRAMSDDEWRHAFRRDLQNIGFEFDSQTGDVSKFPPTEVMEQYQKSAEFRDLILASGSLKAGSEQQDKNKNNNNNNNNNGPKIEEYDNQKQEEEENEEKETNKQQTQKDDEKETSTTTTSSNKKSKKGKKNKRN
ncbi:hypothetical protein DDB_G0291600 [Dictyostelium discoideum AX4]|uniref:Putative uncharacterized transmembrane protein DDB_G0291600 n=1 Tax=Dictyostelium discoideum TaxID=44689 RepID=Y4006_DICDI|nr:hypothetical protein DDB_G0291600 [Dictyostelium discoideum AX4]Q54EB4.1 RecName: Full=Putative uncharacterized transmembrane protein DDB_G0291600 [Dictyostelium discoideum]EAL61784.1 hypothetical protein DDB_G0291600 [Dictyostelium discoideum AX4]|eukprot:XP_635326.1 hypothetical protein DDB_G0291600 [Dictyostelium discoideum AX4]